MFTLISAAHPTIESVSYAAVPTDPASLFVYALLVAAAIGIWRGSRSR